MSTLAIAPARGALGHVVGAPLAGLFGAGVWLRRLGFDHGWLKEAPASLPVLSVGGLEVGGSGKTPVTGWLLRTLLDGGRQPGLATRGYGRPTRGLGLRHVGAIADPLKIGDEPAMLVQSGLDVPVAAHSTRRLAAQSLAELGCDTVVLDDGFAHRRLRRDLDIVVLRGETPFGNGHLLPWGTLREPPSSLRRANIVWLHHKLTADPDLEIPMWWQRYAAHAAHVVSVADLGTPQHLDGAPVAFRNKPVIGAAGIAHPDDFAASLRQSGVSLRAFRAFADHQTYTPQHVKSLRGLQARHAAVAVVVTAKDAVKLASLWPNDGSLWVLPTTVRIVHGEEALFSALNPLLQR